jgi:hypothetical protein
MVAAPSLPDEHVLSSPVQPLVQGLKDGHFGTAVGRQLVPQDTRRARTAIPDTDGARRSARARDQQVAKCADGEDNLEEWGRTSLSIVIEFPADVN